MADETQVRFLGTAVTFFGKVFHAFLQFEKSEAFPFSLSGSSFRSPLRSGSLARVYGASSRLFVYSAQALHPVSSSTSLKQGIRCAASHKVIPL